MGFYRQEKRVRALVSTVGGYGIKSGQCSTWSIADKGRDRLEVMGIWKEIDELERFDLEAARNE